MVPVTSLLIPILVSAVLVFIASSIMHMVLPYHRSDFRRVRKEDELFEAIRKLYISPGDYMAPYADSAAARKEPAFQEKMKKGPVVVMTVMPGGMGLASSLVQWFLYSILVSIFAAYIAGRALEPGSHYLEVFRFAGCVAFVGYSLALLQNSIWYKRNWAATLKSVFDGLVYGLLTAGTFGWLWPPA